MKATLKEILEGKFDGKEVTIEGVPRDTILLEKVLPEYDGSSHLKYHGFVKVGEESLEIFNFGNRQVIGEQVLLYRIAESEGRPLDLIGRVVRADSNSRFLYLSCLRYGGVQTSNGDYLTGNPFSNKREQE